MINGSLPVRERNIPTDLKEAGYNETLMDEDMSYSSYLWFYSGVDKGSTETLDLF